MGNNDKVEHKEEPPGVSDHRHHGGSGKAIWEGSTMMSDPVGMVFLVNRGGHWVSVDQHEIQSLAPLDYCTAMVTHCGGYDLDVDASPRRGFFSRIKLLNRAIRNNAAIHWPSDNVVHWLPETGHHTRTYSPGDKVKIRAASIIPFDLPAAALTPSEKDADALLDWAQAETEAGDVDRVLRDESLELLGLADRAASIRTREELVEAIAAGFPSSVIKALRRAGWTYEVMDKVIVPRRTLMRRKSTGQTLTPAESDAAWRLAYGLVVASLVFASREAALAWLTRSKDVLKGRSPAELLQSSVGTDHVLSMLRRIDHGDYV